MAQELVNDFQILVQKNQKEIDELNNAIEEKKSIVNAAIEANKRAQELKDKQKFYQINLSNEDLEEIYKLREILPYLKDKEPLNKVIWKVYYEKPTNDLITRVIGSGIHCGIYKITNVENNMCYVGQSVDLAQRWKQHIKRGLGAETPTRNKLYPAMKEFGVENFIFEVVEECQKSALDSQEDFW
jgi:hypothetical protein